MLIVYCYIFTKKKNIFSNKKKHIISDRVNHKPIITKAPQNQTLNVGAVVTLQCTILSDLHLHIQWVFCVWDNCSDENKTVLKVMV